MNDKYYQKSLDERTALSRILELLPDDYDYQHYFSPAEGYDVWDCVLMLFQKGTNNLVRRFLIEAKVRDAYYPQLLLEKKKHDDLKKVAKQKDKKTKNECYIDIETEVIYLCITPKGSYWFNLSKIEPEWHSEYHNASTMDKSQGKILKAVTHLDTSEAKSFDITTTSLREEPKKEIIKEVLIKQEQSFCLFKYITKKEEEK